MSDQLTEGLETPEGAAAALAAAVASDQGVPVVDSAPGNAGRGAAEGTSQTGNTDANQSTDSSTPEADAGTTSEDDSLLRAADIDLSSLTPDAQAWLQAREREMQAVMTKRTQEAAETIKQFEGLDDPTAAREALAFYKGIQEDPNYAAEVYDFLTQNLTAAGYSPAQAAAKAAAAMTEEPVVETPAPSFADDPDAAIQARLDQLDQRQRQIDTRISEQQAREEQAVVINRILQQENAIRQSDPSVTDQDVDYIYALAESTAGDLFKAKETYDGLREQAIAAYVAKKESGDTPPPPATPPAEVLTVPHTLEEGYKMGLERLRRTLAEGSA